MAEDKIYTGQPETNTKLENIRTIEEYYNDQIQAIENKRIKLEEILRREETVLRDRPEITEVIYLIYKHFIYF